MSEHQGRRRFGGKEKGLKFDIEFSSQGRARWLNNVKKGVTGNCEIESRLRAIPEKNSLGNEGRKVVP